MVSDAILGRVGRFWSLRPGGFGRFWTLFGVVAVGFGRCVILRAVGLERFGWFRVVPSRLGHGQVQ